MISHYITIFGECNEKLHFLTAPTPPDFKFQFIVQFKTFPLGGRCPRKGADEGNMLPLISQKSKIFASFSPGRSFCAFGAERTINPNL